MTKYSNTNTIAILASGNGTNFQAIVDAVKKKRLKATIKLLVTDKENAFVRKRARKNGVPDYWINPQRFLSREAHERAIVTLLKKEKIKLVVLAGYMRILTPYFVKAFKNKILNIHPALLPSFRGEHAITQAYDFGCKVTGVTVHFVDEKVDHGPIILQEAIAISKGMSLKTLEKKIHRLEHLLYPQAIKLFLANKLTIKHHHVTIR